jgi:hypothetical protein
LLETLDRPPAYTGSNPFDDPFKKRKPSCRAACPPS